MLRLSKKADYALMAMKHLALRGDQGSSSAREIAAETFISVNTVRSHVKSIYLKLGVTNRTDAIRTARLLGLLPAAEQHVAEPAQPVRPLRLARDHG